MAEIKKKIDDIEAMLYAVVRKSNRDNERSNVYLHFKKKIETRVPKKWALQVIRILPNNDPKHKVVERRT